MGRENERDAFRPELSQALPNELAGLGVEPRRGFVQHQQLWLIHQRPD